MRNVVVSTLSEEAFEGLVNKFEEMEVDIIEKRYDLLWHRYEIYVKINLRQRNKLRKFINHRYTQISYLETPSY